MKIVSKKIISKSQTLSPGIEIVRTHIRPGERLSVGRVLTRQPDEIGHDELRPTILLRCFTWNNDNFKEIVPPKIVFELTADKLVIELTKLR